MPLRDEVLRQRRVSKDERVAVVDVRVIEIAIEKRAGESAKDEQEDQPSLKTWHEPEVLLTSCVLSSHLFAPAIGEIGSMTAFVWNELESSRCSAARTKNLAP